MQEEGFQYVDGQDQPILILSFPVGYLDGYSIDMSPSFINDAAAYCFIDRYEITKVVEKETLLEVDFSYLFEIVNGVFSILQF